MMYNDNEIYYVKEKEKLMAICDKLKYVKDCQIEKESFYYHIYAGALNKRIHSYISYKNDKMNGCLVLSLGKDLTTDLILSLVFVWIDEHCPKLWLRYVKFAEDKAREFGAKRILINTKRNAEAIERKLGKYGYLKKYSIFEKEVI